MARSSARASRSAKKNSVRVDLSNISKAFEPGQEYAVRCTEASLDEGQKAPYFNLKLQGLKGGEFENSVMYHRASTSESSLWRLRPLLEAFGIEIPDGPLDLSAEDFLDREAMCSTYLDRYDGGSSVKPDEFWLLDGDGADGENSKGDNSGSDFDLDELSDEEIDALAEALEVKGRNTSAKKKALAKLDQDDVAEAYEGLGKGDEEGKDPEFSLDDLSDEEVLELAEAMELKASTARRARSALGKEEIEEVEEAWEELQESKSKKSSKKDEKSNSKSSGKKKKESVTEDQIQDMSEDELEEVVSSFELDVDLSEMKTLRKMKNAVIDAMEEGGHFDS